MERNDWILYCDICGQRTWASQSYKLSNYTGRGGMVVCRHDRDKIDWGLMPYATRPERNVPFVRINHQNTDNASALLDLEVMALQYGLLCSQDGAQLLDSSDSAWLQAGEKI